MRHVCAAVATNYIASVLANETIFIPFSWGVAILGTFRLIWLWNLFGFLFARLDLSSITFWSSFLFKLTFIWFRRVLLNGFTNLAFRLLFIFWLRRLEIFNKFTFLLDSLPSAQNRWFHFLNRGSFFCFRLFWTFFLLADGKLVGCLLKHFQADRACSEVFVDLLRVSSPCLFQLLVRPELKELKFELLDTVVSLN